MGLLQELGVAGGPPPRIDDIEKQMASGGLCPEGVHHAVLDGVGEIPGCEGRGWKLTFKILAGPGEGSVVSDKLWKPKGDDAAKDKKTANRILLYGHRLGLLKRGDGGSLTEVEGKHDFNDCYGAACFIEVRHVEEEYDEKDKDGRLTGKKKHIKKAELTWEGLLSPDDKKCKDVPRGKAPPPGSIGKPSGGPAAKKDDFGDL